MILSGYQCRLLSYARNMIENRVVAGSQGSYFVCIAIGDAHDKFKGRDLECLRERDCNYLKSALVRALDGRSTFEAYFYMNYGYRRERLANSDWYDDLGTPAREIVYLPTAEFFTLINMARIAWIDRMLDNYEVK
jgi:hypothetical protein